MAEGWEMSIGNRSFDEWRDMIESCVDASVKAKVIAIAWFAWGSNRGYEQEWRNYREWFMTEYQRNINICL
jgi:hypothetical protein